MTEKQKDKLRIEWLKNKLSTDIRWARKAMYRIYENQTASEKESRCAEKTNGVGFTKFDAKFISGLLDFYSDHHFWSRKQEETILKAAPKYAEQLLKTKTDVEKLDRMMEETAVC